MSNIKPLPRPANLNQHTAKSRANIQRQHPGLLGKSPRAYVMWSVEEDAYLLSLMLAGVPKKEIAVLLERQISSISSRLRKLSK